MNQTITLLIRYCRIVLKIYKGSTEMMAFKILLFTKFFFVRHQIIARLLYKLIESFIQTKAFNKCKLSINEKPTLINFLAIFQRSLKIVQYPENILLLTDFQISNYSFEPVQSTSRFRIKNREKNITKIFFGIIFILPQFTSIKNVQ